LRIRGYNVVILNNAKFAQASIGLYNKNTIVIPVLHNDNSWIYSISLSNSNCWDAAVCVGDKVHSEAIRICPNKKIIKIYNGVTTIKRAHSVDQRSLIQEKLKILYVGRLENEQKGIFFLPQIISEIRKSIMKFELCIVGDGKDRILLERMFCSDALEKFVEFKGLVANNKVHDMFHEFHVFILPSYYEGMPITILESMSAGCVPVVSHLPKITDICIDDGEDGFLVPVGNTKEFALKICRLYKEPELFKKMSYRATSKIEKKFSVEIMSEEYIKLISSLSRKDIKRERFQLIDTTQIEKRFIPFKMRKLWFQVKKIFQN